MPTTSQQPDPLDLRFDLVSAAACGDVAALLTQASTAGPDSLTHNSRYQPYGAFLGRRLIGVIRASTDSDFTGNHAFVGFSMPPGPHAFIDSVHVHPDHRSRGVGRALLAAFAQYIADHVSFIGGSIDLSDSDAERRRNFFRRCGFGLNTHDNFGAAPHELREL